jgi:membrane-bound inhibitor of C-type lysozyme
MKYGLPCLAVLGFAFAATPSLGASSQPPMDQFNNAFYNCDNNGAFLMSYDSSKPKTAAMTTSNNSKRYEMKRTDAPTGVKFSSGDTSFWTDGTTVTVEGTEVPLQNCKIKSS